MLQVWVFCPRIALPRRRYIPIKSPFTKYQQHGVITDLSQSSHTPKLSSEQIKFIDNTMAGNETKYRVGVNKTEVHSQLVRAVNMEKRLSWCKQQISAKETFDNVIFTDGCSVQLDNHGRLCF